MKSVEVSELSNQVCIIFPDEDVFPCSIVLAQGSLGIMPVKLLP